MKKLTYNLFAFLVLLLWLIVVFYAGNIQAADAKFSWIPNEITPAGYKIHYGKATRDYDTIIDLSLPEVVGGRMIGTVTDLEEGETYFFAATAYNIDGESDYSTEVEYRPPLAKPLAPGAFQIFADTVIININP